ncbi:carboxymuconolactone decarboxylase family protein [Nocardia sp. NPDC005825]|uniref:carboxymuconolactone decarboxylase family protein n=1 Tax=unclassified Nocardia TaxID=2637762 RepID=UPI0033E898F3
MTTTTIGAKQGRYEHGMSVLDQVDGAAGRRIVDALSDTSPELGHQVVAWAFGDMYSRPELPPRDRQLVTLGVLTALLHSAVYCGMPRAINATMVAKKVFGERDLLPISNI